MLVRMFELGVDYNYGAYIKTQFSHSIREIKNKCCNQ